MVLAALQPTLGRLVAFHDKFIFFFIVPVNGVIKLGVCGEFTPCGPFIDGCGDEVIDDREEGNADYHSDKSEHTAKQEQGKGNPEFADAGSVAEYLGTDDIAVDLLKNDDEYTENNALPGIDHKYDKGSRYPSDKGPEKRDYICYSDDRTYEQRVWHICAETEDKADYADDDRVDKLTGDKAAENFVPVTCSIDDAVGVVGLEEHVYEFF